MVALLRLVAVLLAASGVTARSDKGYHLRHAEKSAVTLVDTASHESTDAPSAEDVVSSVGSLLQSEAKIMGTTDQKTELRKKVVALLYLEQVLKDNLDSLSAKAVHDKIAKDQEEVIRLHQRFLSIGNGESTVNARQFFGALSELQGPLDQRLSPSLKMNGNQSLTFRQVVSALGVFCENTPPDDKVRAFFRLYDADGDGRLSCDDIRSTLKLVLPDLEHDIVQHAVQRTMYELAGSGGVDEGLALEQYTMVAADLAGERGTAFF